MSGYDYCCDEYKEYLTRLQGAIRKREINLLELGKDTN